MCGIWLNALKAAVYGSLKPTFQLNAKRLVAKFEVVDAVHDRKSVTSVVLRAWGCTFACTYHEAGMRERERESYEAHTRAPVW